MNKIVFAVALFVFIACTSAEKEDTENVRLPFIGEKEFIPGIDEDTVYHTLPFWSFVNQNRDTVSKLEYDGKVYVADFFFTHCPGICKTLTKNMKHVQQELNGLPVWFISHTVDPKRDTVERLKWYCQDNELNNNNWNFVTGEQQKIYELGVKGYLVPNQEDALAPGGFLHSDKFILIDPEARIRGMYSGGDDVEVAQLIEDIKILTKEYEE